MNKKVWIVMCGDVEGAAVVAICESKETALKVLFEERDRLVAEYTEMLDMDKDMYQRMIDALSGDNYEEWNNYPHECPYLYQKEVLP